MELAFTSVLDVAETLKNLYQKDVEINVSSLD